MSPLQAQFYVVLVQNGALPASAVAQVAGVDKSDAYRVLRALRKLGLVEVELREEKSFFSAVMPERAIHTLLDVREDELEDLKGKGKVLSEMLRNASKASANMQPTQEPFFRIVSGNQVFNRWSEAILHAKKNVIKVIPGYTLPVHFVRLSDVEAEQAKKVSITIVTEITQQNMITAAEYYKKIKLHHALGLSSSFRYLLIDDAEVFMGGTPYTTSIEDHVVMWTNNKVFVEACIKDFEGLMKRAIDAKLSELLSQPVSS